MFGMCYFLCPVGAHSSPRQFSKLETASLLFFSVLTVCCPLPGNCFVVHGDVSKRMICWKKTFTNSLVEDKASENVREKSLIAPSTDD